jgi:hypothetical protein
MLPSPTSRLPTGTRENLPFREKSDPLSHPSFRGRKDNGMEWEEIEVKCYSGLIYAERPQSFFRKGKEHKIANVENEWLEPGKKLFRVVTEDEKVFQLCYNEPEDKWWLTCME